MTTPVTLVAARLATMMAPGAGPGEGPLSIVENAALVMDEGRIAWLGPESDLPTEWSTTEEIDLGDALLTPGLVECHTHLLYGGDDDETLDLLSRVERTRSTDTDSLYASAAARIASYVAQGVTTVEVKTGYGLDTEHELRLLDLAARLREDLPISVRVTLLAGHAYPLGITEDDREDYIIALCDGLLTAAAAHGGYDTVEVYCEEERGLTMEDCSTILETVYRKKVPTRVAADQLSDSAGGALAPAFYARAAIHLNFTDDIAVRAMGNAGTTAVLVPAVGALAGVQQPPVELLREHGVPIAVATGHEPGPDGMLDLRHAGLLATERFGLTSDEALVGITRNAARALGVDGAGILQIGGPADVVAWETEDPYDLISTDELRHRTWASAHHVLTVDGAAR